MVKRTQSKKFGGKTSKTFIAEQYFMDTTKTNEEIALILSQDISKTTINQVEVMRSRWKAKLNKVISNHPEMTKQVRKQITTKDWQQSTFGMLATVNEQLMDKADKLSENSLVKLALSGSVGIIKSTGEE